jgi:hypothetical protein
MTANEIKLIEMIRNHKNPEQALSLAVEIILDFLTQPESFGEQESASLQESS